MCGIAGFWGPPAAADILTSRAMAMTDALERRGPDGFGHWADAGLGLALGHRRLAILDLSETGRQPMQSSDGRFVMTYNGEIYNFQDLRQELASLGVLFRGTSDTEVLLEGFCHWGVEETLCRTVGMFALAVLDRAADRLILARDRFGEKPLYYGHMGNTLLFGSDPSALAAHPAFTGRIDHAALALYLRFGYVPTPHCIFAGIRKLPPAALLEISRDGQAGVPRFYWDAVATARAAAEGPPIDVEALDLLLRRTVRASMVSDVPLGVFLSGGIDSSLVAALMQAESLAPVHTFTIGFHEAAYNEAEWAARVARHLGTRHTELYVTPEEAMAVVPLMPTTYHEPFADSSQVPTYLVSRMARNHVTVALSGDGGDEVFGGYTRYIEAAPRLARIQSLPRPVRRLAAAAIRALPNPAIHVAGRLLSPILSASMRKAVRDRSLAERAKRFASTLDATDLQQHYLRLVSVWPDPEALLVQRPDAVTDERVGRGSDTTRSPEEQMMLLDTVSYLPDDILVKVDRAAMAVSLEARAPLLSHEVFAAAWSLPLQRKIAGGRGKLPMRAVLERYVPRELIERPKAGFGVPIDAWLRGPLRDWAERLLSDERLRRDGLFDPVPIRKAWAEHLSGRRDRHNQLWVILMFNAWLDQHQSWLLKDSAQ